MRPEPNSAEEALEIFLARRRSGENIDPSTFAAHYPHFDPELSAALAALLALDRARTLGGIDEIDLPARIGPYRIVREIGRGGMGVVLEAIEEPLGRRVALKILPAQLLDSTQARARFRREAELAARLDHSGIATIFGTGVEADRPWIAMRFVEGLTLARTIADARDGHASCARLPRTRTSGTDAVDAVVECIAKVARALQAAHEQGVVHRDVKPSNIIVGADGNPVLLDFGLAIPEVSEGQTLTRTGDTAGTPAYIAPEIVGGERARPDAQSDIYALGVSLYECLTLRRPFDAPTPAALYHAVLSDQPSDVRALNHAVGRDLAVVVATSIERDPKRRYATAAALAADLERYLRREPVLARPPSAAYRLRKFAQRNKVGVGAGVLIVLLLVTGLIASIVARNHALALKERAETAESAANQRARELALELDSKREMLELQSSWLRVEDLDTSGRDVRLADVLDSAARALDERGTKDPSIEAALRCALGRAYYSMTLWDEFLLEAGKVRDAVARGGVLPPDQLDEMERMSCVADALRGRPDEAFARAQRFHATAALSDRDLASSEPAWRMTLGEMLLHQLRYEEAARELAQSVDTLQRIAAADNRDLLEARMLLCRALRKQGKVEEAGRAVQDLLSDCERLLGPEHYTTSLARTELCEVRVAQRRFDEARQIYESLLASYERRFGPDSESALGIVSSLAWVLREQKDPQRSEELARRAAEGTRRLHGPNHAQSEARWARWGQALIALNRVDEGLAKLEEVLQSRVDRLGPLAIGTLEARSALGMNLYRANRFERANEVLRAAYAGYLSSLGPEHPSTLNCANSLAVSCSGLKEFGAAADILEGVLAVQSRKLDPLDPDVLLTLANLAAVTRLDGDFDEACCFYGDLFARRVRANGANGPTTWNLVEDYASCLMQLGQPARAFDVTTAALDGLRAQPKTSPERLCVLLNLRARAALAAHLPSVARSGFEEALELAGRRLSENSRVRADTEDAYGTFLAKEGAVAEGIGFLDAALSRFQGSDPERGELVGRLAEACERAGLAERAAELRLSRGKR